jgi:hypothetical protein
LIIIPASAIESLSIALPEDQAARPAFEFIRVAERVN